METNDGDEVGHIPHPPLIPEANEPPQLPMNGMIASQKYSVSVIIV